MTKLRKPKRRLYLAYGSNLDRKAMRERAPGARPAGSIILDNARLVFRGVADVICEPGQQVPCGLWSITPDDEERLDRYEGVKSGFYNKDEVVLPSGESALLYTMNASGIYPPSEYYVASIRRGYRDFGLDQRYLDDAIAHSWDAKAPCNQCRERRIRQVAGKVHRKLVPMPEELALKLRDRRIEREAEEAAEAQEAAAAQARLDATKSTSAIIDDYEAWKKDADAVEARLEASIKKWKKNKTLHRSNLGGDPQNYRIESDQDGFYLVDDASGEQVDLRRWRHVDNARHELDKLIEDHLNAQEDARD